MKVHVQVPVHVPLYLQNEGDTLVPENAQFLERDHGSFLGTILKGCS